MRRRSQLTFLWRTTSTPFVTFTINPHLICAGSRNRAPEIPKAIRRIYEENIVQSGGDRFLAVSLSAFAQSGDAMKQDSGKQDTMKQDQMKDNSMQSDKKSAKAKRTKTKKNDRKKDDNRKKDDDRK